MARRAIPHEEAVKNKREYIRDYNGQNYDRLSVLRTKGEKDKIKEYAKSQGMSLNEFVNYCVDKELKTRGVDLYK